MTHYANEDRENYTVAWEKVNKNNMKPNPWAFVKSNNNVQLLDKFSLFCNLLIIIY